MCTEAIACLSISTLGSEPGIATPLSIPVLWIGITLMRIRIRLITLMRIQMRIRILILFDADPDPTFYHDADPRLKPLKNY
jgi:hypothetical protein